MESVAIYSTWNHSVQYDFLCSLECSKKLNAVDFNSKFFNNHLYVFVCNHIGKNKRLTKGKKGGKKKAQDPFLRKELYTIRAPSTFVTRNAGKTLITKTTGTSKCD